VARTTAQTQFLLQIGLLRIAISDCNSCKLKQLYGKAVFVNNLSFIEDKPLAVVVPLFYLSSPDIGSYYYHTVVRMVNAGSMSISSFPF